MRKFLVAVVGALALLLSAAVPASAGLGDPGVVGAWTTYNTNDGSENGYGVPWTPETVQDEIPSEILSHNQARLSWADGPEANLGTSIETDSLTGEEVPEGGLVATFSFKLEDGAVAGGGAPRLFVEVDGTFYNSADHGFPIGEFDSWGPDADGGGQFVIPEGTIGRIGIVYDNGVPGSVVVSAPTIGTTKVWFTDPPAGPGEDDNGDEEETKNGPPHEGGSAVSEEVRDGGAPPAHSKGKAHGRNGTQPSAPQALGGTV